MRSVTDARWQRTFVGGIPVDHATSDSARELLIGMAAGSVAGPVRLVNAYSVALASQKEGYRDVLCSEGLNFADGFPVVAAMRMKARTAAGISRVRGPSLFSSVLDCGRESGVEHFFVGTTETTLEKLVGACRDRYPGIRIAGTYAPPFAEIDDTYAQDIVARVGAGENRIVWLALGTPKQDFLSAAIYVACGSPCVAVGAAFDFEAGTVREAPRFVQRAGMEWLFRLGSEPRRLWRRYLVGNLVFLRAVIKSW